ncbi:MAG: formimidoylglutamate deiminase [Thermoanaerobaculia bacterium]|nr:formimidoylglutamate deiminase [Thermoanaerobaculia bacterium]
MAAEQILEADWTWTGAGFEPGVRVVVGADGRIREVGAVARTPTLRLSERALLPGFVNAHSHAFQRGLRGVGEEPGPAGDDFWGWRESMYSLASTLDQEGLYRVSRDAYREMRRAGITAVGEFHYLRHAGEDPDFALDEAVLQAAHDAGIRLVLLPAYYRTGGIRRPLTGAQLRFRTPSAEVYWGQTDRLARSLRSPAQTLGAAVHSVRAAAPAEIAAVRAEAARRGWVCHMHVEEQQREIEECRRSYGSSPLALLDAAAPGDERFTAVHCTRSEPAELLRFLARGGRVCLCPLTEAALGDGWIDLEPALAAGAELCLGSDSNARISFAEEMRWLELGQRLRTRRRAVVRSRRRGLAATLLHAATAGGAASLGLPCGGLARGQWADFAVLDLTHPTLAGARPENLATAFLFGAGNESIDATAVGGRWGWRSGGERGEG